MSLDHSRPFLSRLVSDVRGNTLAIMAAAMFPMIGLVGGGIDIGRMYITKTRLQHACDAGALAGRKAMGGGTWAQTVNGTANYPQTSAQRFFDANFLQGSYGSGTVTRAFTESNGKVMGSASVPLPMTLMKVFNVADQTLAVTCSSEMRLPNTDIMFVLDTTGSMGEIPAGDTQTKMASLKTSVKCFYEIVARLDTDATCTTGTPGGGTGNQVQIRFGFVPYSMNVNVGRLLNPAWFADQWNYQSREPQWTQTTTYTQGTATSSGATTSNGNWYTSGNEVSYNGNTYTLAGSYPGACSSKTPADSGPNFGNEGAPYAQQTTQSGSNRVTTYKTDATGVQRDYENSYVSGTCYYGYRDRVVTRTTSWSRTDTGTTTQTFSQWHYGQILTNVAGFKSQTSWPKSITLPIGSNGTARTVSWDGCIEERATVRQSSYNPIPSGAQDLDIDTVPSSATGSQWGPALRDTLFARRINNSRTTADVYSTQDMSNDTAYVCPVQATKMQSWPTATAFDAYVDQLQPNGNTYHDIGLLWGARLMSPTGIFGSENALTPAGGEIQRNMIFMTDGDACTDSDNYQAYGWAWYDRRQTDPATVPTEGCTETGTLTQQVNARTSALCTAIKNKNITLWVVTFGYVAPTTVTRMTNCASPDRYFAATNAATLQSTFASIANQISQLRLTQ